MEIWLTLKFLCIARYKEHIWNSTNINSCRNFKNIYGEEIDDFILGYVIYHDGTFKDLQTIYKEINPNVKTLTDSDRFQTDVCPIEYLINPKLIIYTNIDKNIEFNEPLCLGKTNCLAKVLSLSEIEVNLIDKKAIGYNQYTDINIGDGMIKE